MTVTSRSIFLMRASSAAAPTMDAPESSAAARIRFARGVVRECTMKSLQGWQGWVTWRRDARQRPSCSLVETGGYSGSRASDSLRARDGAELREPAPATDRLTTKVV